MIPVLPSPTTRDGNPEVLAAKRLILSSYYVIFGTHFIN